MAKVEVIKSEKADKPNYIWICIVAALIVIGVISIMGDLGGNSENENGDRSCGDSYDCRKAVNYALREVPDVSTMLFDDVKSNELKCVGNSITSDEIILVKCTTNHQALIEYYGSSTIWYGYIETADGMYHYQAKDKDKDVVLEKLRK